VNDTRDNDTVAAIVGAAVGALHGKSALPARWIRNLLGRTNEKLIDQARACFVGSVNVKGTRRDKAKGTHPS